MRSHWFSRTTHTREPPPHRYSWAIYLIQIRYLAQTIKSISGRDARPASAVRAAGIAGTPSSQRSLLLTPPLAGLLLVAALLAPSGCSHQRLRRCKNHGRRRVIARMSAHILSTILCNMIVETQVNHKAIGMDQTGIAGDTFQKPFGQNMGKPLQLIMELQPPPISDIINIDIHIHPHTRSDSPWRTTKSARLARTSRRRQR